MTRVNIPRTSIEQQPIDLDGGLDLVTRALKLPPGALIDCGNFVPNVGGGYRLVGGYEAFDGRAKPSDATYRVLTISGLSGGAVGQTVTGATSGATSVIASAPDGGRLVVTKVVGAYLTSETLNIGGSPIGTLQSSIEGAGETVLEDIVFREAAGDIYRADIQAVPGSGPVRGVHVYKGVVYAWRNDAGGTALVMHKATASGWSVVGGVPALLPGGRVRCINWNFSGGASTQKMYGCDGVNNAFEFDGTTYTQITTGASPDTPSCIAAHVNRLFLSVLGSLLASSPGSPTSGWAGVGTTPAEFGTGDLITDILPITGSSETQSLAILGSNKTSILYGSSNSTWKMVELSPDAGAISGSAQFIGGAVFMDGNGVTSLSATQRFGNFEEATISDPIKPMIKRLAPTFTASSLLKSQNQYRVWFSDGTGIAVKFEGGSMRAACPIYYDHPVRCVFAGEGANGEEVVFFGSDNGFVYQSEVGSSFNGQPINAWMRLAFNHVGGPSLRKTWRRVRVDLYVEEYAELLFSYEHDYSSDEYGLPNDAVRSLTGGGGNWESFVWDEFVWDSPYLSPPTFKLDGTSSNVSLIFRSDSRYSKPFVVQSLVLHFSPRRLDRSAS